MKLSCVIIAAALIAICCPSVSRAAEAPLRVAVSGPYPPFAQTDDAGNVFGFDVDIAYAVCKEINRECVVENVQFDDIIPMLVDGRLDFAVAGMGATEERKKLIDFTERYYRSMSIFIERNGTVESITPQTLKGKRVGAQAGSVQAGYLEKTYGDAINLVTTAAYEELFIMLKKGEVDLVLSDGLPGYAYLTSEEGEGLETIGDPIEPGGHMGISYIAVPKNRPELRDSLSRAIGSLRRSGEYDKINRKYFDFIIY